MGYAKIRVESAIVLPACHTLCPHWLWLRWRGRHCNRWAGKSEGFTTSFFRWATWGGTEEFRGHL